MKNVMILTGAGQIGMAIARRMGYGMKMYACSYIRAGLLACHDSDRGFAFTRNALAGEY